MLYCLCFVFWFDTNNMKVYYVLFGQKYVVKYIIRYRDTISTSKHCNLLFGRKCVCVCVCVC